VAITFAEPREQRFLENIERLTKQKIGIERLPTIVDLRARKLDLTRAAIEDALATGDSEEYRVVLETLSEEHDMMSVAMAAIKLVHEARGKATPDEEIPIPTRSTEGDGKRTAVRGKKEKSAAPRAARRRQVAAGARGSGGDIARLYIGLGRSSGMRPADIVGAIANEAGVSPEGIGSIDIADNFSIVEVPEGEAKSIIAALRGTKLRGKRVVVREDHVGR
jgi:ATP-dependent RNA helicase DeaD